MHAGDFIGHVRLWHYLPKLLEMLWPRHLDSMWIVKTRLAKIIIIDLLYFMGAILLFHIINPFDYIDPRLLTYYYVPLRIN